jgi:hypothetical protein
MIRGLLGLRRLRLDGQLWFGRRELRASASRRHPRGRVLGLFGRFDLRIEKAVAHHIGTANHEHRRNDDHDRRRHDPAGVLIVLKHKFLHSPPTTCEATVEFRGKPAPQRGPLVRLRRAAVVHGKRTPSPGRCLPSARRNLREFVYDAQVFRQGVGMKAWMILLAVILQSVPARARARDMIDEKTHEYTPYGLVITMVAGAQVSEMKCNQKGQIDLAIAKAGRLGVPINVNDKEDFSAVLFQATEIMTQAKKQGLSAWCNAKRGEDRTTLKSP